MPNPRVLIIDTDIELYNYSIDLWNEYGIFCKRVNDIEQALVELMDNKYHLIIIVECKELRTKVLNSLRLFQELTLAPIIIISRDPIDLEYSIAAYDSGAIEVWVMPENIEEAVAKGNSIIRNIANQNRKISRQSTIIINKQIVISTLQRLVFVKSIEVTLTKREFDLLRLLITYPGRVFTYEQIYRQVWGDEYIDNPKEVLRNKIYLLREKLQIDPMLPDFIKTHRGVGYSFIAKSDNR